LWKWGWQSSRRGQFDGKVVGLGERHVCPRLQKKSKLGGYVTTGDDAPRFAKLFDLSDMPARSRRLSGIMMGVSDLHRLRGYPGDAGEGWFSFGIPLAARLQRF